jgi:hypothetical protein
VQALSQLAEPAILLVTAQIRDTDFEVTYIGIPMSPFYIGLTAFGLVVAFVLGKAFLRRGSNILETQPSLPGEVTVAEHAMGYAYQGRVRALVNHYVFVPVRVRVTSARVLIAQQGLGGGGKHVLRCIVYRVGADMANVEPWQDGYYSLVINAAESGIGERDGQPELKLVPAMDGGPFPLFFLLRGAAIQDVAEALGIPTS